MKKLSKFIIAVCASFFLMLSGCDRNSGGLSYFQLYNNTDSNLYLQLYFSHSLFYNDTIINIENKKLSGIFTQEDTGPGISRVMILMSADSIDFITGDTLLKRYRHLDSRNLKTPYSKEFYDSTYVNNKQTVYIYTILSDDFK